MHVHTTYVHTRTYVRAYAHKCANAPACDWVCMYVHHMYICVRILTYIDIYLLYIYRCKYIALHMSLPCIHIMYVYILFQGPQQVFLCTSVHARTGITWTYTLTKDKLRFMSVSEYLSLLRVHMYLPIPMHPQLTVQQSMCRLGKGACKPPVLITVH